MTKAHQSDLTLRVLDCIVNVLFDVFCTVVVLGVCMCGFCNVWGVCMYGFCNVWVCRPICVGVLVICVLVFTAFLYSFVYVYLF
jgi:hypothetical protein